jgi:hypothetical protein
VTMFIETYGHFLGRIASNELFLFLMKNERP